MSRLTYARLDLRRENYVVTPSVSHLFLACLFLEVLLLLLLLLPLLRARRGNFEFERSAKSAFFHSLTLFDAVHVVRLSLPATGRHVC